MSFSGKTNETTPTVITNDGWWPDMPVADFQARYRLPTEYAETVLSDGLVLAMVWANHELSGWRLALAEYEYSNLEAVPAPEVNGESSLLIHYRRAIYSHAKAYLLKQFPTINRREAASNEARESDNTEDKFLEYAQTAIAAFLGKSRITAELI